MSSHLTQRILNKALKSKKTELGVGFGGEPEPAEKPMVYRNDAQKYNQYPKPTDNALIRRPGNSIDRLLKSAPMNEQQRLDLIKKPKLNALNKLKK